MQPDSVHWGLKEIPWMTSNMKRCIKLIGKISFRKKMRKPKEMEVLLTCLVVGLREGFKKFKLLILIKFHHICREGLF